MSCFPRLVFISAGKLTSVRSWEGNPGVDDYSTEHNTGHEVAVGPGGPGPGFAKLGGGEGGRGERRSEPELLVQHAGGAAQGGAGEDRGLRERVASAKGRRRLRGRVPQLAGNHQGDREGSGTLWEIDFPDLS